MEKLFGKQIIYSRHTQKYLQQTKNIIFQSNDQLKSRNKYLCTTYFKYSRILEILLIVKMKNTGFFGFIVLFLFFK